MSKPLIPFKVLPGSWGLKGKAFERAKAEYELEGDILEIKLAQIEHGDDALPVKLLQNKLKLKNKEIDQYTHDKTSVELQITDETAKNLALLDVEKKHGKIHDREYDKQFATLKQEPWVSVIKMTVDKNNPNNLGEVELDWNELFVIELKKNGYNGSTDYSIVDSWFTMVCASVANDTGLVDSTDKLFKDPGDEPPANPAIKEYF